MLELVSTVLGELGVTGCLLAGAPAAVLGLVVRQHATHATQRLRAVRARLRPIASLEGSGPATVMGRVVSVENGRALLRDRKGSTVLVSLRAPVDVGAELLVDGVASPAPIPIGGYRDVRRLWLIDASGDGALTRAPISGPVVALRVAMATVGSALFASGVAVTVSGITAALHPW